MINFNSFRNSVFGFVAADCLGVPFEFYSSNNVKDFLKENDEELKYYGNMSHDQKAGTWSDDTAMMLCNMEWLIGLAYKTLGTFDIDYQDIADLKNLYNQWRMHGKFSCDKKIFDIGYQTAQSLKHKDLSNEINMDPNGQGNGALMRVLPFAFILANTDNVTIRDRLFWALERSSAITHDNLVSHLYCKKYVQMVESVLRGGHSFNQNRKTLTGYFDTLPDTAKGWVKSSYECVLFADNLIGCDPLCSSHFINLIYEIIVLGGDTDTNAAVVGGFAGASVSQSNYVDSYYIRNNQIVENMVNRFWEMLNSSSIV